MRLKATLNLLIASGLFFLVSPSVVAASSNFIEHDNKIIFQTKNNIYRHRNPQKPLQLSEFTADKISASIVFGNKVWLVGDIRNNQQQLFVSINGLSYKAVEGLVGEELTLTKLNNKLAVARIEQTVYSISFIFDDGDRLEYLNLPLLALPTTDSYLETAAGTVVFTTNNNLVKTILLTQEGWQDLPPLECQLSSFRPQFLPVAHCANGKLWLWLDGAWINIINDVIRFDKSADIIAAQISPSTVTVWFDENITFIDLSPIAPSKLFVFGKRVVIGDNAFAYELVWQFEEPELILIDNNPLQQLIIIENEIKKAFLKNTSKTWLATESGWQLINSQGNFNHARLTPNGYLVWQTNEAKTQGGLTQFLPLDGDNLIKVNSWSSTTSPIQAIYTRDNLALIGVITNSGTGNFNLYRSFDYRQWDRLTLPSKPTLVVSVAQARQLTNGTLVEINGVMSVNPGLVGNEIAYLEDETGGIQIYLHSSKGTLPSKRYSAIRVTAEISSSQVKRLILADVTDLEVMSEQVPLTLTEFNADLALNLLGRVILLKDRLGKTEKDHVFFGVNDTLKIHFKSISQSLKEIFLPEDLVSAAVVIDWNSVSNKVEGWYLGEPLYLIHDRPKLVPSANAVGQDTSKTAKSAAVSKRSANSQLKSTKSPASTVKTVKVSPPKTVKSDEAVVAASRSDFLLDLQPIHLTVLIVVTLLSGLLVAGGRLTRLLLKRLDQDTIS